MAKVLISPKAEKDIDDIADYIALDHPERAVKFLRFLSKKLIDLASTPFNRPGTACVRIRITEFSN